MPARHARISSTWTRCVGVLLALLMLQLPSSAASLTGAASRAASGKQAKCRSKRCLRRKRRLRRRRRIAARRKRALAARRKRALATRRRSGARARRRARARSRRRRQTRRRFVQLQPGSGYHVLRPRRAWGTQKTVSTLEQVLTDFRERFPNGPTVYVHDLSARWGGRIHPHKSHRLGRDVDIRVICSKSKGRRCRFSAKHNWYLLQTLIATGEVKFVFTDYSTQRKLYRYVSRLGLSRASLTELFQYPRSRRVRKGIIRHEPRHRSHFHVRFRRPDRSKLLVMASL